MTEKRETKSIEWNCFIIFSLQKQRKLKENNQKQLIYCFLKHIIKKSVN